MLFVLSLSTARVSITVLVCGGLECMADVIADLNVCKTLLRACSQCTTESQILLYLPKGKMVMVLQVQEVTHEKALRGPRC